MGREEGEGRSQLGVRKGVKIGGRGEVEKITFTRKFATALPGKLYFVYKESG